MKIVFLSARYPPDILGGGEVSTRILAEALAAAGEHVTVYCGSQNDREEILNGVRVRRLKGLHPWWAKPLQEEPVSRETARVLRQRLSEDGEKPDVIHAQEFRSALTLSLLTDVPRYATIRDFAPICGTTNNMWWDGSSCNGCFWPNVLLRCHRVAEASLPRKPFRVLQYKGNLAFRNLAYHRIEHHLYASRVLQERVEGRLRLPNQGRSVVIPNPVDPSWLSSPPTPPPDSPVLCAAGRLETTKGTDVLLDALHQAKARVQGLRLHLVGGGEVSRYAALAKKLSVSDAVTFHGHCPEATVRSLVDASTVVVSPHLWEEPFGRSALEAGARGRPLIASDLGGVRETTTRETALLVPAGDPSALAEAITTLLNDKALCSSLGSAARARVEQHYRADRIAQQLLGFYRASQEGPGASPG